MNEILRLLKDATDNGNHTSLTIYAALIITIVMSLFRVALYICGSTVNVFKYGA